MESQAEALGEAPQKLGEIMYAESQAKAQPAVASGGRRRWRRRAPRRTKKVVDAEYTEVNDRSDASFARRQLRGCRRRIVRPDAALPNGMRRLRQLALRSTASGVRRRERE